MDSLIEISKWLKAKIGTQQSYYVPQAWNSWGFSKFTRDPGRMGEILVDPYELFSDCIDNQILAFKEHDHESSGNGTHSCCSKNTKYYFEGNGADGVGADPARLTVYSMLIRAATAWEHCEMGQLCSGTFLKALSLLPYLRNLGVGIVYLLPVFSSSDRHRKGETGSPYSIKNIYKIDSSLHDPLLGEYTEALMDMEFKAFVEACHLSGMRVMVDYPFRTVSRDNDLIIDHPDWFYWIDIRYADTIAAPAVGMDRKPMPLNDRTLSLLYKSREAKEYLKKFVCSPEKIDAEKWRGLVQRHYETGENILDLIETEYRITTLPGFSDVINDSQPPWTDVTYLRYFFDINEKAAKHLPQDQPPYIMQDGVCLRLYPGSVANAELMAYISNVIPYYQDKYGIDGARLDMGHALTQGLNREIISRAKEINSGFLFWSEEFCPEKSGEAKKSGFHFINGMLWSVYKDVERPGFNRKLIKNMVTISELPMIAALETPDTPRAAWVYRNKRKLEQLIFMNCFMPNTIQFINNGFDLMELQPMNLGLDNSEQGRYVLEKEDPMYGRLAFFDHYQMHWLNSDREWIYKLLVKAADLRKRYIDIISVKKNFLDHPANYKNKKLTILCYAENGRCYAKQERGMGLFIAVNRDFAAEVCLNVEKALPDQFRKECVKIDIVFSTGGNSGTSPVSGKYIRLDPGEVIVGELLPLTPA